MSQSFTYVQTCLHDTLFLQLSTSSTLSTQHGRKTHRKSSRSATGDLQSNPRRGAELQLSQDYENRTLIHIPQGHSHQPAHPKTDLGAAFQRPHHRLHIHPRLQILLSPRGYCLLSAGGSLHYRIRRNVLKCIGSARYQRVRQICRT